jgi:hypothetical protein
MRRVLLCVAVVLGLGTPGFAGLIDIAPHWVVPPDGAIVDANAHTWTVTYSSMFDSFTRTSLWDGYYGDQQHLDPDINVVGGGWLSASVAGTASIYIDMGVSYNVGQIKLWNFGGASSANTNWGFKDFEIFLGANPNPTTEVASGTLPRGYAVNGQPYANYVADGIINLTPGASGRYLTISGLNTQGDTNLKGLSEIGVLVNVPEPSALVLCAAGMLGLLAYAWRKWK